MNSPAEPALAQLGEPRRTAPVGLVLNAIMIGRQLVFPLLAAIFAFRDNLTQFWVAAVLAGAIFALILAMAVLRWWRLTYTVGAADIRVESGVLSRSARSVPYERIQDVSLEEPLLARLLGLVAVKFETGAGGGEDMSLTYLSLSEGERLRRLVRERREEVELDTAEEAQAESDEEAEVLFAMDRPRLIKFGLFEFSLAVFAVLAGVLQYVDNFTGVSVWDPELWGGWLKGSGDVIAQLGMIGQILGVIAALAALIVVGSATGLVRTFLRDWGFVLERTPRGFRRRRGLLTRTDVMMPVHRVQGIMVGTRLFRYRFGWHSLRFISLAQDAGAANHDVAPFAQMDEIAPVVESAGFHLPAADTDWHRASDAYRRDSVIIDGLFFALAGLAVLIASFYIDAPWLFWVALGLFALAVFGSVTALYSWQFKQHALDATQIMSRHGLLSPQTEIATRLKLHSVEISQGPIARRSGYATLHLGLAGGSFAMAGVPIQHAREMRREVLKTISQTDFSRLN